MNQWRVGVDLGGTKAAVRAEPVDGGDAIDTIVLARGWDAEPIAQGAAWIDAAVRAILPAGASVAALAVGAQGLDSEPVVEAMAAGLRALGYRSVACLNDAALLVPAAGFEAGLGLIAGTGAIGVGQDATGRRFATGGWGWVLGDDAGAAGIVREATRASLQAHDDDEADDGLLSALLAAFDVADAERLARAVNDLPTMESWGPHAPAVFAAADAGSALARSVVHRAAEHLAMLVDQLRRRGAVGLDVVTGGSVIANQPRLAAGLAALLDERHPDLTLHALAEPPVAGALAIARTLPIA
jgi:N-acetylglucosamine kinase-like BadF-type ATPase